MRAVNYKSYDGNLYRVVFREGKPLEMWGYLRKTYGVDVTLPINVIKRTKEVLSFFEITKVSSEEEASPVIRVGEGRRKGEGKPRCPYCWEKRCFRDSLGLHAESGIRQGGKYTWYSRIIGKCFNPKYDKSYFMIEYRLDYKLLDKMLRRKQCPFCKGDNAASLFDRTNEAKFDTFFGKPTPPDLKKMLLETRTFMRNYEYRCKACKLKVRFDINLNWVNKKNKWLYETLSSLSEQNQVL